MRGLKLLAFNPVPDPATARALLHCHGLVVDKRPELRKIFKANEFALHVGAYAIASTPADRADMRAARRWIDRMASYRTRASLNRMEKQEG